MKKGIKITLIAFMVIIAIAFIFAKTNRITPLLWSHHQVNQSMFSDVAINAYDPVAYFKKKKAVKGEEKFSHLWNDAMWYFSSEENKALFAENPQQYAPKYGGYCAFAVSKGFTANTDPETFEIIDGSLFLFADSDVKHEWMKDIENNLIKCKENW